VTASRHCPVDVMFGDDGNNPHPADSVRQAGDVQHCPSPCAAATASTTSVARSDGTDSSRRTLRLVSVVQLTRRPRPVPEWLGNIRDARCENSLGPNVTHRPASARSVVLAVARLLRIRGFAEWRMSLIGLFPA